MLISADEAVARLDRGDLVALPTETVYGLAGLALSPETVKKIFALKGRSSTNPLIIHLADLKSAEKLAVFNNLARQVCKVFWPGPLTIVLTKTTCVPNEITGGGNTVAIRSPLHPLFREILKTLGKPLAAPSANPSNRTSPTQASHIKELFGSDCPPTVDGGNCKFGLESTVLDLSAGKPRILRYGPITPEEIENVLSIPVQTPLPERLTNNQPSKSPGSEKLHYAPRTPFFLHQTIEEIRLNRPSSEDLLLLPQKSDLPKDMDWLSSRTLYFSFHGKPEEIAFNLYKTLIQADKRNAQRLLALLPNTNTELCLAIRDRMTRACNRNGSIAKN